MKTLILNDKADGYSVVGNVLFKDGFVPGQYLVQMQIGMTNVTDYLGKNTIMVDTKDITEFLTVDEKGIKTWETDWWKGQDLIIITGFTKINAIDISQMFPV